MPQATVTIINTLGLHLRASSKLSQLASRFGCEVWLTRGTKKVNAKSVLGVTMLAAGPGTEVTIITEGDDAAEALQALTELVASRFGEDQ